MDDYKVLLIYPRITSYKKSLRRVIPPLSLTYIAAVLENEGHKVSILDAALEGYNNIESVDKELIVFGLSLKDIKKSECFFTRYCRDNLPIFLPGKECI